jgi:His-Xaa-Ser system radical SAM maturase HxsC
MRTLTANVFGIDGRVIARVCQIDELRAHWTPEISFLVPIFTTDDRRRFQRLIQQGLQNIIPYIGTSEDAEDLDRFVLGNVGDVMPDDVIALICGRSIHSVIFRSSDFHHTVFVTNQCNSYCLMCSQPPTKQDDSWLLDEALVIAAHIRVSPPVIGFTGGEPLLHRQKFRDILDAFLQRHPTTLLEVLTNGRLLSKPDVAECVLRQLPPRVSWMVPMYGAADFMHDYVVQSPGAFDETVGGLLQLASFRQSVQIRIVLIQPVLDELTKICDFIVRNFPFVVDVALMGCEPTGFALANRDLCQISYSDWGRTIEKAAAQIESAGIRCVIMNIPLCQLPRQLWKLTSKSISDWKNTYASECDQCAIRSDCCGLFASYQRGWMPGNLKPVYVSEPS